GTDERVQLVEEQDDVLRLADLFHHRLEALFELAPVLGAGDQRAQVELEQPLVHEHVGHVVVDDLLSEALDDGRLAHARLADQHRVVLRAPGQDLDDALDLLLAPDDRIQLTLAGQLREVTGELVEDGRLRPLLGPRVVLVAEERERLLPDLVQTRTERLENLRGDRLAFLHQAEEEVLGADVVVAELAGLFDRELEDALGLRRKGHFTERERLGEAGQGPLDLRLHRLEPEAQTLEDGGRDPLAVARRRARAWPGRHRAQPVPASISRARPSTSRYPRSAFCARSGLWVATRKAMPRSTWSLRNRS